MTAPTVAFPERSWQRAKKLAVDSTERPYSLRLCRAIHIDSVSSADIIRPNPAKQKYLRFRP
jgi:hypothetical protein